MTTRREFLATGGAIVVGFSLPARAQGLPGHLEQAPYLDAWIRVDAAGAITVFTGKCELGQGLKTAIAQVAAEELEVPLEAIRLVTADTGATPDEGFTAGSNSMKDSATTVRHAAAEVRELLRRRASNLHVAPNPKAPLKDPAAYRIVGKSVARVDIPAKVTGGEAYVHDLRLPGMLHARVVRPVRHGASLVALDAARVEAMPGVVKVVRDDSFLAVVAEREWAAIQAMEALAAAAQWSETPPLPDAARLPQYWMAQAAETVTLVDRAGAAGTRTFEATYARPYQIHGSIGPSCAVAQWKDGTLTVWSHTQGVYPDRAAIAEMLAMPPEAVRVIHAEGAGCYGHNGADDAAADAAVIARALPGRPVRLQWMRAQEHAHEPYGPAMVSQARAALDAQGRIVDWEYGVWSNTHSTRPGGAAALLAGRSRGVSFQPKPPLPSRSPEGMGDRNAIPLYATGGQRIRHHFIARMPLRVSALRALGAYHNVFAIESFMDELAAAAGADPVEFRLRHLEDARAREVVTVAARRFGWRADARAGSGVGQGFAFARYKNAAAYCAVACEVQVDRATGRARLLRAAAAIDSGQVINPDGLRNQVEGGILQSASWTLHERVAFDAREVRSLDWATYPILRFDGVPESVEVEIVDRPGAPFLGSGEAAQGPTAGAVANALAHATGRRLRELPFTRDRVRA